MNVQEITFSEVTTQSVTPRLHYFKCLDCLTPVSLEDRDTTDLFCDCGSVNRFEYMGRVQQDMTVVNQKTQCKCNSLCTHAAGPSCDCVCGGVNHGLGMKAYATVDIVTGKVQKRIKVKEKAIEHAIWFRSIVSMKETGDIYGQYKHAWENRKSGSQTMSYQERMALYRIESMFFEFKKSKTVKKRQQMWEKIKLLAQPQVG